jgi:hypothetical protein
LNEMADGTEQITEPEKRVVTVAQGVKYANGVLTPLGCASRKGAKAPSSGEKKSCNSFCL